MLKEALCARETTEPSLDLRRLEERLRAPSVARVATKQLIVIPRRLSEVPRTLLAHGESMKPLWEQSAGRRWASHEFVELVARVPVPAGPVVLHSTIVMTLSRCLHPCGGLHVFGLDDDRRWLRRRCRLLLVGP